MRGFRGLQIRDLLSILVVVMALAQDDLADLVDSRSSLDAKFATSLTSVDRWIDAGILLRDRGALELAIDALLTATRLGPQDPRAFSHIGIILERMYGDAARAAEYHAMAIRRGTLDADSYYLMGNFVSSRNLFELSVKLHEAATKLKPDFLEAYNNKGSSLISLGNLASQPHLAQQFYRQALEATSAAVSLNPRHRTPLVTALTLAQKTADFRFWKNHSAHLRELFVECLERGDQLFMPWQASVYGLKPFHMLKNVQYMSRNVLGAVRGFKFPKFDVEEGMSLSPSSRLRVGYFSCSGFQGNTTTANFVRGLFGMHDRHRFHVHCFARGTHTFPGRTDGSPAQEQIRTDCESFHDMTKMDVFESAKSISASKIAVLVDLTGWTLWPCTEVLAMEPSPVQLQWHGYPGSMGADFVHYVATDRIVSPPEYAEFYTERMLYTLGSYMLNDHVFSRREALELEQESDVSVRRERLGETLRSAGSALFFFDKDGFNHTLSGFEDDDVIMCSWNTLFKCDPDTLQTWITLLRKVPKAKLWIMQFDPTPPPNVALLAADNGVDVTRIAWSTFFPRQLEFKIKSLADVFVDTPLFNAHTTGVDALWCGTPLVTVPLEDFSARVAAGLVASVSRMQLGTTVARSMEDYEQVLTRLTSSARKLRLLREDLDRARRKHSSDVNYGDARSEYTLFRPVAWVKSWESALMRAADLVVQGEASRHILSFNPVSVQM
uniref:protein O-GlcNAc transferase n=1 Tax=Guillardia theta TaxID=55529 RepID=A0A7S4NF57_GUITH|mmetsp:Transcript_2120/g.6470  ORF Transcript_2120/g.6470 Transcript_2120/m.6470 type:complete len:723 (+) Transcript_2120:273-2441(+)